MELTSKPHHYMFCFKLDDESADEIGVNRISRFRVRFEKELTPEQLKEEHEKFGRGLAGDYHMDPSKVQPISEGEFGQLKEEYADDEEAMEEIFGSEDDDEIIDIVLPNEEVLTSFHFKDTKDKYPRYYKAVVVTNKEMTEVEYEKQHNDLGHELAEKMNIDFCFIHKVDKEEYDNAFKEGVDKHF